MRLIFLFYEQTFSKQHYVDLKDLVEGAAQPQPLAVLPIGEADESLSRTLAAPQRDGGFRPLPRTGRAGLLRTLDFGDPAPEALETSLEASETLLQADVFPYSQPSLVVTGGTPILCWVRDNLARSDENRTDLVTQGRAAGGVWSDATPVWDDGTADFAPALAAVSNGLLLAWQNTAGVLPPDATLADTFAAQEIGVAFLSKNRNGDIQPHGQRLVGPQPEARRPGGQGSARVA